jgi:hypothetical protein
MAAPREQLVLSFLSDGLDISQGPHGTKKVGYLRALLEKSNRDAVERCLGRVDPAATV